MEKNHFPQKFGFAQDIHFSNSPRSTTLQIRFLSPFGEIYPHFLTVFKFSFSFILSKGLKIPVGPTDAQHDPGMSFSSIIWYITNSSHIPTPVLSKVRIFHVGYFISTLRIFPWSSTLGFFFFYLYLGSPRQLIVSLPLSSPPHILNYFLPHVLEMFIYTICLHF